jgi:CRP-like cAMP-binding protein
VAEVRRVSAVLRTDGRFPTLAVPVGTLHTLPLDHRAGFLVSLLDGNTTIEALLDICGMPAEEAVATLEGLRRRGLITWRGW